MSNLVKEVFIYNLCGLVNSVIPFLLLPFLSNFMDSNEIGIISLISTTLSIITLLIGFNTHYPISIYFYRKRPKVISSYIISGLVIPAIASALIFALCLIFGSIFVFTFKLSQNLMYLIVLLSLLQSIINLSMALLQIQRKLYIYNGMLLFSTALNACLSILLVVYGNMGWQGRLIAIIVGMAFSSAIGIYYLLIFIKKYSNFKSKIIPPIPILKDAFKTGNSLLLFSLSGLIMSFIDRYIIAFYCDISALGIYSMAYSFGMIPSIFASTINRAWFPYFCKILAHPLEDKKNLTRFMLLIFLVIFLVGALVAISASWIFKTFIGASFSESIQLVPWLCFAYVLEGMATIISGSFLSANKGFILSRVATFCAIVNFILTIYLVGNEGVIGAAKATFYSYLIFTLILYFISPRFIIMPGFGILNNKFSRNNS